MCVRSVQSKPRRSLPRGSRRRPGAHAWAAHVCSAMTTTVLPFCEQDRVHPAGPEFPEHHVGPGLSWVPRATCRPTCNRGLAPPALQAAWPPGPLAESVETRKLQWWRPADMRTWASQGEARACWGRAVKCLRPGFPFEQDWPVLALRAASRPRGPLGHSRVE